MRGFPLFCIGLLLVGLTTSAPLAQEQEIKEGEEEYSAILTNISNVGRAGLTPVNIHITRWTPDEENARVLNILRNEGQDAFLRALVDLKSVGWIATPTSLRYDFFYARSTKTDEGGRRILLITDRPMQIWERLGAAPSRDYPFTVVELRLDKSGTGNGTLAQLVQLRLSGDVLGIENLASGPMKLNEVKRVK
jgi:hypothetical protein